MNAILGKISQKYPLVNFDDVVWYQEGPGVRNTQYTKSGTKLLNVANLHENNLVLERSKRFISNTEANGKYNHFLVDEGDLIIASSGITLDTFGSKIAFAQKEHLPLCMNTSTIRFKPNEKNKIDLRYLKYFFNTIVFKDQLRRLITGTAQLNFGPSHLKQMKIPLPPLPEQRRIADILDKADSIRRKRQEAIALSEEFLRSVFLDMFGDPVTNPKGWNIASLTKVTHITSGSTPSKSREDYWSGEYPWVSPKDMKSKLIVDSIDHVSNLAFEETNLKKITQDAVLIVVRGMILAHTVPIAINGSSVAINQDIKAFRAKDGLNPVFLLWNLLSQHDHILSKVSTSAHGTKKLDNDSLEEIMILLPPVEKQNDFEQIYKGFIELAQDIKISWNNCSLLSSSLTTSLLSN